MTGTTTNGTSVLLRMSTLLGIPMSWIRVQYNDTPTAINNTATITAPAGVVDPVVLNNSTTDSLNVANGSVVVATTTNIGISYSTRGSVAASFSVGDRLSAVANTDGSVDVWKTTAANVTTYLGRVTGTNFNGTGSTRVGVQVQPGSRVDDFRGGVVP
jgi:hypothetical protein